VTIADLIALSERPPDCSGTWARTSLPHRPIGRPIGRAQCWEYDPAANPTFPGYRSCWSRSSVPGGSAATKFDRSRLVDGQNGKMRGPAGPKLAAWCSSRRTSAVFGCPAGLLPAFLLDHWWEVPFLHRRVMYGGEWEYGFPGGVVGQPGQRVGATSPFPKLRW
jgi:hypothetical protein